METTSNSMSRPGACERCHKYKEKCRYENARLACYRCNALRKPCRPRLKKRMGRRPIAQPLPYGATSVIQPANEIHHPNLPIVVESGEAFISAMRQRKRDCRVDCQLMRLNRAISFDALTRTEPPDLRILQFPSRALCHVSQVLENQDRFFQVHRTFVLGRSFVPQFQYAVRRLFDRSPWLLSDIYSVALKLLESRHTSTPELHARDLAIGARCLQMLNNGAPSINHLEDAATLILLGQALLVYNTLISSPSTQIITRGLLSCVRNWYPALLKQPHLHPITLTPVLMDTIECLIRREIPVINVPQFEDCVVDRFAGVCCSFLPLLHELCVQSYDAKQTGTWNTISSQNIHENDKYSGIEHKIRNWRPHLPSDFFTAYSALEVRIMLAQARSYRLAALLVIHRLRFPLGTEDTAAQRYADEILHELGILKAWPPGAATGLGLDFPLLVATLESPGPGTEIYKAFEPLRFRRQHSEQILNFIEEATAARNSGFEGLWFDLVYKRLHEVTLT